MKNKYLILFILLVSTVYSYGQCAFPDVTPPLIFCPSPIVTNTDPGSCTAKVDASVLSYPFFFDCGGATLVATGIPLGYEFPIGTTTVTWTATDNSGNSASCTQLVTVTDEEDPIITCPANIVVNTTPGLCNANVTVPLPMASDNCSIASITNNYNTGGANASGTYPIGTTTVTYTVTDHVGRTATCAFDVTVVNSQIPVITLVGLDTITLEACEVYSEQGATAEDVCLGDISGNLIIDSSSVDTSIVGSYLVTYTVNGVPSSQITRNVNVIDTTAPILALKGPNTLNIGDCSTYTELGATVSDCTSNLNPIVITGSVDTGTLGTYYVTYNVQDSAGNSATPITRTVNVIDINIPEITLIGPNPQMIDACTPYNELGATAIDLCSGNDISGSLLINASSVNTAIIGSYNVTYNVIDANGNSAVEIVRTIEVVDTTILSDAGPDVANTSCTDTTIILAGNDTTASGINGLWTVTSGQTKGFSFSDPTNATTTFIGDVGETYELTWSINNPCGVSSDTMTVTFMGCNALDFDGIDDNITFINNYDFSGAFTIEVWIKSETTNGNVQTILSKREANNQIDGYDLRLVNNIVSFNWNNGNALISPYPITSNIWHHTAITYDSGNYKLYIDGVEVNSASGVSPISNAYDCIIGAMDQTVNPPYKPLNYFKGDMDELRIWNVALTANQIHKMMNQEIENNSGSVKGAIVPLNIAGLSWINLIGYYQMNQSTDIINGKLMSSSTLPIDGTLRYMTTLQEETAPLPYTSNTNGLWSNSNTWLYGNWQTLPNSMGVDGSTSVDWNIVRTSHHITSGNKNITVLGLDVNSNILSIENTTPSDGQSLRITDYLKIDGTLDLVGESQLLQDMGSIVDLTGTGKLQRDQQGTTNLYNYNYWGSPVSVNGTNYSINAVLKDGTNPNNPLNLQWTSSYDANGSTVPITLSNRWLYSYENYPKNSYASWRYLGANGSLNIGNGFIMKGSGALSSEQNYVFIGKPNNGSITVPITAGNQALVGNPYPSAIDANEFIFDNISSTQGTLYFWEHYNSNATHVLRDYQGGYATYNLVGGNAAVSPPEISGIGTPSKIPERYVPVAQGFFVESNGTSGTVIFENDQRFFVKEGATGPANNGSVFMKNNETKSSKEELIKRIRIDFKSPETAIRHLLLGFVPNGLATDGFDYGYDAIVTDNLPSDLLWIIDDKKYVIQGVGDFNDTKKYPLGMVLAKSGNVEISLQELENFESEINVFIYDALLGGYTKIDAINKYQANFDSGTYLNRFYLAFKEDSGTLSIEEQELQAVVATYLNDTDEIYIKVPASITVKQVYLINILGQGIKSWNATNITSISHEFKIPVRQISEGTYIIKLETSSGTVNKKVIVKF